MSTLARLLYSGWFVVARGLRGMVQTPAIQVLAVGTMAVCMVLLCTVLLLFSNATRVADSWGIDVPITAYLHSDIEPTDAVSLADQIAQLPEVSRAEWIDGDQAASRLEASLGQAAGSFDDLAADVLPHSIEIYLRDGYAPGFPERLADTIAAMPHVEEVARLGPWVDRARSLVRTSQALAWGLGALVSIACTVIAWSMIRLAVFARRSEIEILRVVGSTVAFVRAPFVVEGVLQGVLGAGAAVGLLQVAFQRLEPLLADGLALLFLGGSIEFFTPLEMAVVLGFGAAFGALGSRAAVGHHVRI